MKKMPTIFQRDWEYLGHGHPITEEINPECQWVFDGEGVATRKYDGTCVLIRRDGLAVKGYARREVKKGKQPPANFFALDYDDTTGKIVGWEPIEQSGYAKYFAEAVRWVDGLSDTGDSTPRVLVPGTYELVGPKINGNPEGYDHHDLIEHATAEALPTDGSPRTYEDIRALVLGLHEDHGWEGVVYHHPLGQMAKIKAKDFR